MSFDQKVCDPKAFGSTDGIWENIRKEQYIFREISRVSLLGPAENQ